MFCAVLFTSFSVIRFIHLVTILFGSFTRRYLRIEALIVKPRPLLQAGFYYIKIFYICCQAIDLES
jgi:hypothetical protein